MFYITPFLCSHILHGSLLPCSKTAILPVAHKACMESLAGIFLSALPQGLCMSCALRLRCFFSMAGPTAFSLCGWLQCHLTEAKVVLCQCYPCFLPSLTSEINLFL